MLNHSPAVWLQEAQNLNEKPPEKVFILIYAENVEIAKSHIQYYQQKNQIRLNFPLAILPLTTYLQRHADEELTEKLLSETEKLSENRPLFLYYPERIHLPQTTTPCLTKRTFPIPSWAEQSAASTFALFEVPNIIRSHLWTDKPDDICYALIHAATVWLFPDLFQREGLRCACLFQGEKAETEAKSAPYLVELPAGHRILSHLFCRNGENYAEGINYGERNIGTFFRSSADFDELLNHFRKWLMLQDYTGHWYYLRFFDPEGLEKYLDRLQTYPSKLAAFFNGSMIEKIFCIKNGDELVEYEPNVDLSTFKQAKKQFDKFEIEAFTQLHEHSLCEKIIAELMEQHPEFAEAYGKEIVEKTVYHAYRLAKAGKMKDTLSILQLALANLVYGDSVNYLDPENKLNEILMSDLTEMEKQFYIEKRLDELEMQGRICHQLQSTGANHV